MPDPLLYLKSMSAAAIVSAICVLTMVRRNAGTGRRHAACVLSVGLGLAVGCLLMPSLASWPPVNALSRLLTIVMPTVIGLELIAGVFSLPRSVVWVLRICMATVMPRILLHNSVYLSGADSEWNDWQIESAMATGSVLLASVWGLLTCLSSRSPGVSVSCALCMSILCGGATVMMAGYIKGGAVALPVAAALMAVTLGGWLLRRPGDPSVNFAEPIVAVGVVSLFGMLLIGRFFGRLSTSDALVIMLAPLLCWVTEVPFLRDRKPVLLGSLRLGLVAVPLVVVLMAARAEFEREMVPLMGQIERETTTIRTVNSSNVFHAFDGAEASAFSRH